MPPEKEPLARWWHFPTSLATETLGHRLFLVYIRRKFRSQTSDNMDRRKQSRAEAERRERSEERRVEEKE
jgi:hypothetical protein